MSIKVTAASCAVAGVAIFLRHSPLPGWITLLVPFTFYAGYQYAIIARSYCLLLMMMSLSAAFLHDWHRRPLRFSVALLALSQVNLHGAIIAMAFGAQALLDAHDQRHDRSGWRPAGMAAAVGLFVVGLGLLAALLMPPEDLNFAPGVRFEVGDLFTRIVADAGRSVAGELVPWPLVLAGFVLLMVLLGWALTRRVVFGTLSSLGLCAVVGLKHSAAWHSGTMFLVWIFTLWLVAQRRGSQARWLGPAQGATAAILVLHVGYAAATIWREVREVYSPAREIAAYLKQNQRPGETLWGYDYVTIAVQPYFDRAIFANQAAVVDGRPLWLWSVRNGPPIRSKWDSSSSC